MLSKEEEIKKEKGFQSSFYFLLKIQKMLPQINRLERSDFSKLRHKRPAFCGKYFSLIVKTDDTGESKIGFIISSKVSKKAVERNKIKRVLSGIVKKHLKEIENGGLIVFLINRRIVGVLEDELENEVEKSFKQVKLIR